MIKAHFSFLPCDGFLNEFMLEELFGKEEFSCTFDEKMADFDEMRNAITCCDVYITFSNPEYVYTTFNPKAELQYALRAGVPSVIFKRGSGADYLGTAPLSEFEGAAVFEMGRDGYPADFPKFVKEYALKNRKDDDSFIRTLLDKPYEGEEPHIFISYSHKDKNEVFEVIRTMQEAGYRIWYDEGIDPASEWDENIAEHISRCSYLIAFISPRYISSQNCRDEISYARDLNKERLLVYIEETKLPAGMAMRLMRLQAIHKYKYGTSSEFFDKLFAAKGIEVARR